MNNLAAFIPSLSSIGKSFSYVIIGKGLSREEAISMAAFADSFPSVENIESEIMSMVLNASSDRLQLIVKSLYMGLYDVTVLYEQHSQYYDKINLGYLWYGPLEMLDMQIKTQFAKTRSVSDELREASNSYEMTPFNGRPKNEVAILERRVDKLTEEYKAELRKLDALNDEKSGLRGEMSRVCGNVFRDIYIKCDELLPIVEKYLDKTVIDQKESAHTENQVYVPMSIVAPLYELCNGVQFEPLPEIDFFRAINLQQPSTPLDIRKGEKARVSYLVSQLSERIQPEYRSSWIDSILDALGIEQKYYRSKYREPVSDMPSRANEAFAKSLKEILRR